MFTLSIVLRAIVYVAFDVYGRASRSYVSFVSSFPNITRVVLSKFVKLDIIAVTLGHVPPTKTIITLPFT